MRRQCMELKIYRERCIYSRGCTHYAIILSASWGDDFANYCRLKRISYKAKCSAQTQTGMGHLRKPPGVELIPAVKPLRRTRSLRDPTQTQVWSEQVWLDTTFISQGSRSWGKLAVETWRVKTELIIITILHIIIITTSSLKPKFQNNCAKNIGAHENA